MTKKLKYFAVTAALFTALSFSLEGQAHAYADPGSSLLLFQSVSAIVTGSIFYFRRRLKAIFRRSPNETGTTSKVQ